MLCYVMLWLIVQVDTFSLVFTLTIFIFSQYHLFKLKNCAFKQSSIGHFRVQNNSHFKDDAKPLLKKKEILFAWELKKKTVSYQWLHTLPHFETEVLSN